MTNFDGKAHFFLKIPYCGTFVVEIPSNSDHASLLYKVVAAALPVAEELDFFGGQCVSLRISSNGKIIHDCNESLKDMGIHYGSTLECCFVLLGGAECCGFISKSKYKSLKEELDAEYKEKMKVESDNRKAAEATLREELEKERAKNVELQGALNLSSDQLLKENQDLKHENSGLKQRLSEADLNDLLTLAEIRSLLQHNRDDKHLTFDQIRDEDEKPILKEIMDLYCELRAKNKLSEVKNISVLKKADRFDDFQFLIDRWLKEPKPPCLEAITETHSIKERLDKSEPESAIKKDFDHFYSKLKKFDVHGYRAVWARNLGIERLLVEVLPPGLFLDKMRGFRDMNQEELMKACRAFFKNFCVMLFREHAREHSYCLDSNVMSLGAPNDKYLIEMKFASLDDFYSGPETRIGIPNPNLYQGMLEEHCKRPTKDIPILTPNYGLLTTSEIEWFWVVDPERVSNEARDDFLSQNKKNLDDPSAQPQYFFPGEVGQEICEILVEVTYEKKVDHENEYELVENDILERFRMLFMPKSNLWALLFPKNEHAKNPLLRDIRKVQATPTMDKRDSKTVCLALSFTKDLELPKNWDKDTRELLQSHCSKVLDLLSEVALEPSSPGDGAAPRDSVSHIQVVTPAPTSVKVVFPKKAEVFKQIMQGGDSSCSKFIQDTVQSRLFELFANLKVGSSSPHVETESFKVPPYLKDKEHKQGKRAGNKFLEVKVLSGPEVEPNVNVLAGPVEETNEVVAMYVSVFFEINPESQSIIKQIQDNWGQKFKKSSEICNDVAIHRLDVTGKQTIEYCHDVEELKSPTPDQLPQLTIDAVDKNTIEHLTIRLAEQEASISDLLGFLKRKRDQRSRKHGRTREKIESLLQRVAKETTAENRQGLMSLVMDEIVALRLYTGPMYVVYNALLRFFPLNLAAKFSANRFSSTIFAIISGITKLSRFAQVPENRKVYRGLSGVRPPEEWIESKNAGIFVGVEFGLQSTTVDINKAIEYAHHSHSDRKPKRPIIFEIDVGKVDIGASLECISQYPHEKEILMPPLSCLEVVDQDIRLHKGKDSVKEIHVYQLKLNVNLKLSTAEDLMSRHKIQYFQRRKFMQIRGNSEMAVTILDIQYFINTQNLGFEREMFLSGI